MAATAGMRGSPARSSTVFLVVALAGAAGYTLLPLGPIATAAGYLGIEVAAAAAILVGTWGAPRAPRATWTLLGAVLLVWAVGDVLWWTDDLRGAARFPAPADGLYLLGYVGLAVALWRLARRRPADGAPGGLLDTILMWLGVAVPVCLLWLVPATTDPTAGLAGQAVGSLYAVVALLLVLVLARLLLRGVAGDRARQLVAGGLVLLLGTNLVYAVELYRGLYEAGGVLDVGWLAAFALFGAAGLHPDAGRRDADTLPVTAARRSRVVVLWAAAVVAPAVLVLHVLGGGRDTTVLVVTGLGTVAGLTLFALRLWQLLRVAEAAGRGDAERQGQRRLARLVERIHDVIGVHDADGGIRYLSPSAARVWGVDPAEAPRTLDELVHPDDRAALRDWLRTLAADGPGTVDRIEVRVRHADGGWCPSRATGVNLGDDPVVQGLVVTYHDVSEQVAHEEELREHAAELRELAERLQAADRAKDAFLDAASHDLRTPLTTIRGLAELLERRWRELDDDSREALVRRLAAGAARLERLLLDLLDLERFGRGAAEPARVRVDVRALARDVAALEPHRARRVELPDGPVEAEVDPTITERILDNLLGNAVKHTPEDTPIEVSLRDLPGGGVEIEVSDHGPGIPPEEWAHVLEPFARGNGRGRTPGSGIGLSLVERFARIHGGGVAVDERPGGGARFRVTLPGPGGGTSGAPAGRGSRSDVGAD